MYNLVVAYQFSESSGETFRFEKSRFLEYTSDPIKLQLQPLSIEAIECLKSWPCILMEEGRAEEVVRIARIVNLRDLESELQLTVEICPSKEPILNDHLWRIREELDIAQFEFSRNHWAVKDRNLFSILGAAGHECDASFVRGIEEKSLPAPTRGSLINARNAIADWSHAEIDDLLLEVGITNLSAARDLGSRRNRADAIIRFAIANPTTLTAEKSLLSSYLVERASLSGESHEETSLPVGQDVAHATRVPSEGRSPNRVFVVHGQNETVRSTVVSYLENLGLYAVVLHEQPNMGRHLLTKFIQEADLVTFAIVLMTGDDVGGSNEGTLAPRARQNVILELGYFLAHLGQARVCALISPGLETPSDFDGIVYISMADEHRWQQELKRELLAAKLPVVEAELENSPI